MWTECKKCKKEVELSRKCFNVEFIPQDGDLDIHVICPECRSEIKTVEVNLSFELNY